MLIYVAFSIQDLSGHGEEWLLDYKSQMPRAKFWYGNLVKMNQVSDITEETHPGKDDYNVER